MNPSGSEWGSWLEAKLHIAQTEFEVVSAENWNILDVRIKSVRLYVAYYIANVPKKSIRCLRMVYEVSKW